MRPTGAYRGEDEQAEANRVTSSLAGLVAALLIVVAGLFLVNQLRDGARIEDCLLSGRTNCDSLVAGLQ